MTGTDRDFPDWLGPMLVKELRQGLKARAFVVSFIALQALFVILVAFSALSYAKEPEKFQPDALNGIFWTLVGLSLLVVTPLRALNSLAGERKANTLELIFMTGLTSWRIAVGKWASLLFQSALFVCAVLPYGIVRYYFGGVNLTEDLIAIGTMLLVCALLTAAALAISGLPLFFRIGAFCVVGFFSMGVLPGILFGFAFSRFGGSSVFFSMGTNEAWGMTLFTCALLSIGLLEVAAATIAPPAENHALRQRLIVLAAWLPVPVMMALRVDTEWIVGLTVFSIVLTFLVAFYQLSVKPLPLRTHLEPFVNRGPVGRFVGLFAQPGWPSALLFFIAMLALIAFSLWWTIPPGIPHGVHGPSSPQLIAAAMLNMGAAALLTPPLLWNFSRWQPRFLIAGHFLVLLVGGGVALFIVATLSPGHMGDYPAFGAFPPLGFWAMLDTGPGGFRHWPWLIPASIAVAVCVIGLLIQSRPYWQRVRELSAGIRRGRALPPAEETPA